MSTRKEKVNVSRHPIISSNKIIHLRGKNNYGGVTIAYQPYTGDDIKLSHDDNRHMIKVAIAICGVDDNYDRSYGRKIAQARLDTTELVLVVENPDKAVQVVDQLMKELERQYMDKESKIIRQVIKSIDKSVKEYYGETPLTEFIEPLVIKSHRDLYMK